MEHLIKTTLLGLFFGTFGTTLGGIIGVIFKKNSNKFLSFILSLASGLMTAIVCFELIPEAFEISGVFTVLCGIVFGILLMIFCDIIVEKKFKNVKINDKKESLLKTGIIVSIGLAIHNFPEGISMAVPMKNGGMNPIKVIFYVLLSGVTTGVGAFFGALVGGISISIIAICLSFAAGAMLHIVSGELIPESNTLYKGKLPAVGNIIGFVLGMLSLHL